MYSYCTATNEIEKSGLKYFSNVILTASNESTEGNCQTLYCYSKYDTPIAGLFSFVFCCVDKHYILRCLSIIAICLSLSLSCLSPWGCWIWQCGESSGTLKLTYSLFLSLCCSSLLLSTCLFSLLIPAVRQWSGRQMCWWANSLSLSLYSKVNPLKRKHLHPSKCHKHTIVALFKKIKIMF